VPRRIYKVQRPLTVAAAVEYTHGLGLDSYAALPFYIHRIQDLGHPLSLRDGLSNIQKTVG
jgi:hypothetical protein